MIGMNLNAPFGRRSLWVAAVFPLFLLCSLRSNAADSSVKVEIDSHRAGPRTVESLTERGILRDYRFAWANLGQALESNTLDPLEGSFVVTAKKWLTDTITSQRRSGLRTRYQDQNHKLEAVYYAPEGDVIELHDTAEYQLQILDGGRLVHDEHVVMRYVVLMTPGADRWVIRQLQAVPRFDASADVQ